jgi:hypothetical protein
MSKEQEGDRHMAKSKKKIVKFLVSGMVTWVDRQGHEIPSFIKKGCVMALRVEDHFTGGYELWQGDASTIIDKDKVEITD